MPFDECKQKFNLLLVRVGQYLNPEEKNITVLAEKTGLIFGLPPYLLTTKNGDHLPAPTETGPFFKCPKCGEVSLVVEGLCGECKESEEGIYKTKMHCIKCPHVEKSKKWMVQILTEFDYDFSLQSKKSLGIKVLKDPGK